MLVGWTSSNYTEDASMSRLGISYTPGTSSDNAIGMAIAVQFQGVSSVQRAFRYAAPPASPGSGTTFPLNTAIIRLAMGAVQVLCINLTSYTLPYCLIVSTSAMNSSAGNIVG
jgi:hypothetical protein